MNDAGKCSVNRSAGQAAAGAERREHDRFHVPLKMSVSSTNSGGGFTVSPADVENISRGGVLLKTRHCLSPMQDVMISFPTVQCPDGMALPENLAGRATVVRVGLGDGTRCEAGLRFDDGFLQNFEFNHFIDFLHTVSASA